MFHAIQKFECVGYAQRRMQKTDIDIAGEGKKYYQILKYLEAIGHNIYNLRGLRMSPHSTSDVGNVNIKKRITCAYSYLIKCNFSDRYNKFENYTEFDAPAKFLDNLIKDCKDIYKRHFLTELYKYCIVLYCIVIYAIMFLGMMELEPIVTLMLIIEEQPIISCNLKLKVNKLIPI